MRPTLISMSLSDVPRVLVVDDDPDLRDLLCAYLGDNGYAVQAVGEGVAMRATLTQGPLPDVIVLDLMLPGEDGLSLTRWLKAHWPVPVLILSARGEEMDRVIGLEVGADDYLAKPFQTELYMRRQDGSDMWINLFGYVADPADPSMGVFWIAEDRTAFKQAEEALKKAYFDQRLIFDHCVAGIAFVRNRIFQQCNRRFEELYGYGPGELTGQPTRITYFSEKAHAETGAKAYEMLGRGETFVTEIIHRRQNGDPIWLRITGRAIDPAHPDDGSIWNYEDITSRKVAEDSLRESVMLQRAILNSAKLMILSTDSEGHIVSCNPAAEQMLGYPSTELLGRTPAESFLLPEEIQRRRLALPTELDLRPQTDIDVVLAQVRLGSVDQDQWTFRRQDGGKFVVELSISALHPEGKHAQGFLFVASDITERKRAEDALLRSRDELELRVKERTSELESEVFELGRF